jgi:simple sugar transport system ATP-binding protein
LQAEIAVRMVDITKSFGDCNREQQVCLDIRKEKSLSFGGNGSGKTTLMNMLSGIYSRQRAASM